MADHYFIDCSGACRMVYTLAPPESDVLAGLFAAWMVGAGWTRNARGQYFCSACSQQHENDHAPQETPHYD